MTSSASPDVERLARGIRAGERNVLSRAITLIESKRPDHRHAAIALTQALLRDTGNAVRVGITGPPGVGKSTMIDALGSMLTGQGHLVAVLAVDPSSRRTGGSILADKTRMARLANDANAFIRPSPSSGTLGGVAAKTRETMLLCEAAGYDVLIVETVGVGQSETTVADMTDFFLVLMVAGAGDELQGLKKGIVELADMIAVNKSDGDNIGRARVAASDYRAALHILAPRSPNWSPPVLTYSALTGDGISLLWEQIVSHKEKMTASGELSQRRREQQVKWMWSMLEERLTARLRSDPAVRGKLKAAEAAVDRRIAGRKHVRHDGHARQHRPPQPRHARNKWRGRIERRAGKRAEAGKQDRSHQTPSSLAISSTAKVGASLPAATAASAALSLARTAASPRSRAVSRSSSMLHIHFTCCSRRRAASSPEAVILSLCSTTRAHNSAIPLPVSAE